MPIRDQAFEILVVDNNSQGDATERVAESFGVKYVQEPIVGLCAARNRAIVSTGGDILAYTNDDCEVNAEWISTIRIAFSDPAVGCVTGPTISPVPKNWVQRAYSTYAHCFSDKPRQVSQKDMGCIFYRAVLGVGANMAVRRKLMLDIDGFPLACGDADDDYMFIKVVDRGFNILYTPSSIVYEQQRERLLDQVRRIYEYGLGTMKVIWHISASKRSKRLFLLNGAWAVYGSIVGISRAVRRGRIVHLAFNLSHMLGLVRGLFLPWGWRAFWTGEIPTGKTSTGRTGTWVHLQS